jgi:hypothetical protein
MRYICLYQILILQVHQYLNSNLCSILNIEYSIVYKPKGIIQEKEMLIILELNCIEYCFKDIFEITSTYSLKLNRSLFSHLMT